MAFYIYENWRAEDKTIIHFSNCCHCNNGIGNHRNTKGETNGRWIGPFEDFNAAKQNAIKLKRKRCDCCKICHPEKKN